MIVLTFLGWVAIAFTFAGFTTGFLKLWTHSECEGCGRRFRTLPRATIRLLRDGCPDCNSPETRE